MSSVTQNPIRSNIIPAIIVEDTDYCYVRTIDKVLRSTTLKIFYHKNIPLERFLERTKELVSVGFRVEFPSDDKRTEASLSEMRQAWREGRYFF